MNIFVGDDEEINAENLIQGPRNANTHA